jgi:integrase
MSVVTRVLKSGKVVYYAVVRQNGRQVYQRCDSKRLAKDLNAEMSVAAKNNALAVAKDVRFSVLVERYLADGCHSLRSQTISSYESRLKNHLLPYFSDIKVRRGLTTEVINQFVTLARHRGTSDKSIKSALVTLSAVLTYAVSIGLIRDNPCHRVRAPRTNDAGCEYTLNPEETQAVVNATPSKNGDKSLMLFLAQSGARPSEACEVRFSDVSWREHTITISRTATRHGVNGTKTDKSRTIPLSASLLLAISAQKRALNAEPNDLIFPTVRGHRRQMQRFASDVLRPALTRAGLRVPEGSRSLYILRKSAASNLLQQGESVAVCASVLGQSPEVLLKHYAKVRSEDATAAIDRLDAMMAGDKRDTSGVVVQIA